MNPLVWIFACLAILGICWLLLRTTPDRKELPRADTEAFRKFVDKLEEAKRRTPE